ncbi:MAG: hypothetical protein AAF711_15975 [Planctomycetota bacterium]
MRRPPIARIVLCTAAAALMVLAGCKSAQQVQGNKPLHAAPDQPDTEARQPLRETATSAQMQELLTRMQVLEEDNYRLQKQLSDQYMAAVARRRAEAEAKQNKPDPAPDDARGAEPTARPTANVGQARAAGPATPASPSNLTRDDLLDALVDKIDAGKDPGRVKALMAAAISVASDHKQMDPKLLDALDPRAREQVARFHQMLAVTFDELASNTKATLTRRDMIRKIDEVFGAQPLQIEQYQLCRRVDSYGVYEPFGSTRFLAGRKNRVLVYVELENFKHEPLEEGGYEVRLEQSVELYDATGETTVWRQGPVQLVDVSRNKRRDFFIVYPIDLPARLPAGGYRLKVRIQDQHTGSICEQTMHDIQIVADQALVGGR